MNILSAIDKFKKPVFFKDDSDLQRQIDELESIRNEVDDKEAIDRDIKKLKSGLKGEQEIKYQLKYSDLGLYVLHDVTLKYEDLTAQIDYIIISRGYIYFVECKDLYGNITIDNNGQFIRDTKGYGKKAMSSPYEQATRHIEIYKKIWKSNHNTIYQFLHEKDFDELWFKPLIVLSNSEAILNMKYAPKKIKECVVRVDGLKDYIKKDLDNYDKTLYFTKKNMEEMAKFFSDLNVEEYTSIADKYHKNEMVCPKCGKKLVERKGKYGNFIGCTGYPNCTFKMKKN